jgi:hypothetical protein
MGVDYTSAKDLLEAAHNAVKDAAVPKPLEEVAFKMAFQYLAGGAPSSAGGNIGPPPGSPPKPRPGASLENIAAKLGLDRGAVEKVYGLNEEDLEIIVPTPSLSQRARPAMRELILLTAVGRQAGGWDDGPTGVEQLRSVCEHYGGKYYDSNNFPNAIKDQHDHLRTTGKRKEMTIRVLPAGYTAGAALVKKMAGEDKT